MAEKNKPELIEDKDLEDASGGLPAVQKVREAARLSVANPTAQKVVTGFDSKTGG